jgi:hypothetical protein
MRGKGSIREDGEGAKKIPLRPGSHVRGDVGRSAVKLVFEKWGWTADIIQSDYGEDLDCTIYADGKRTKFNFRCQVKSRSATKAKRSQIQSVAVSSSICRIWLQSYDPILLVLYDYETGAATWLDAGEFLRARPDLIRGKSVRFGIDSSRVLEKDHELVVRAIQGFYAQLLRLPNASFACQAFPVLMPKCRNLPLVQVLETKGELASRYRDHLPAWTTVIQTLQSEFIYGWEVPLKHADISRAGPLVRESLEPIANKIDPSSQLAIVCSPLRFAGGDSSGRFWAQELTDWWSISRIGNRLFDSRDFAFGLPAGFKRQIGSHAGGFGHYHHVDPQRDIALLLFARAPVAPASRSRVENFRRHIEGQFVGWCCPTSQTRKLQYILASVGLRFAYIDSMSDDQLKIGAICELMFDPVVGMFPMASDWESLDRGSVRARLEDSVTFANLPGHESSDEVHREVVAMFGYNQDPAEFEIISEISMQAGLPLDMSERIVTVERFHYIDVLDKRAIQERFAGFKSELENAMSPGRLIGLEFVVFSGLGRVIGRAEVSFCPASEESSKAAYSRIDQILLRSFDSVLPRRSGRDLDLGGTYAVLSMDGRLYFEK